ncbi:MAG: sigma-54 dependent transcriptional regulator [Planctomycetota bacterium]
MKDRRVILVVDDEEAVADSHAHLVRDTGADALVETRPERVESLLADHPEIDVVLLDIRMEGIDGLSLLRTIKLRRPDLGVVMATVVNDIESAVRAIKAGAYNYLLKPLQPERLDRILDSYFSNRPKGVCDDPRFAPFLTGCPSFVPLFERIRSFAETDVTVLLQGETGTGKEIVSRLIHTISPRSAEPFVAVNMAGFTPHLIESELFGHRRGAFTGAVSDHAGYFEAVGGGTLFLDEIGELGLDCQAKLLRVLQSRKMSRVGETTERETSARVVLATNRDLRREVEARKFRDDLYYRISSHLVELPPLRERAGDVELLAGYFLRKYASQYGRTIYGFHPEAMQAITGHPFPGNVRELEGIVSAAVLIERGPAISLASLPAHMLGADGSHRDLEAVKRQTILSVLAECNGNQTRAAEKLGVSRGTLNRWIQADRARRSGKI